MSSRFGTPTPSIKRKRTDLKLAATRNASTETLNTTQFLDGFSWHSDQSTSYDMDRKSSSPLPVPKDKENLMPPPPPSSAVRRTISYLGSWIRPFGVKGPDTRGRDSRTALPVPPLDMLNKVRPTVKTPAPNLPARPPHPKDIVALHNVGIKSPVPLPKPRERPQRMVQLYPISPKPLKEKKVRKHTSSGSVKDMIRAFESLRDVAKNSSEDVGLQTGIRRIRSSMSVRAIMEASS